MATKNRVGKQPIVYCPLCQARVQFRGSVDFNKFNGQICCDKCETLLEVVISENKLQGLKVKEKGFRKLTSSEMIRLANQLEEYMKKMKAEGVEELKGLEAVFDKMIIPSETRQAKKEYKKLVKKYSNRKTPKSDLKKAQT